MKHTIFSNWTFMRFLRLAMGIAILVQAILTKDLLIAFVGSVFTALPIFNVGCCGAAGCATPPVKKGSSTKAITYEEVV